jgi:hypothetical protein
MKATPVSCIDLRAANNRPGFAGRRKSNCPTPRISRRGQRSIGRKNQETGTKSQARRQSLSEENLQRPAPLLTGGDECLVRICGRGRAH